MHFPNTKKNEKNMKRWPLEWGIILRDLSRPFLLAKQYKHKKLRPRFICVRRRTTSSFQPFLLPTDKFRKSKRWGLVRLSGEHWAQSQFQKLPQNSASSEIKEQARQTSLGGLISSLGEQRRQPARCSSWYQTSGHPTNPGISTVL